MELASRFAGGQAWVLYAGTFVAGVGLALGGTLLPGLVKALFPPGRSGLVTGLYYVRNPEKLSRVQREIAVSR